MVATVAVEMAVEAQGPVEMVEVHRVAALVVGTMEAMEGAWAGLLGVVEAAMVVESQVAVMMGVAVWEEEVMAVAEVA